MKKIIPSILTFTSTIGVFAPVLCLSSCSQEDDSEGVEKFIQNRTFSIVATHKEGDLLYFCFGTIWIIDDATPSTDGDYQYYVATNWHVTHGIDQLIQEFGRDNVAIMFADVSLQEEAKPYISYRQYMSFSSYQICGEDDSYLYDYESYPTVIQDYFKPVIDFHICKVDFDNPKISKNSKMRAKFTSLDTYKNGEGNGHINKFVNADDETIMKKTKYVGGYPAQGKGTDYDPGSVWEFHKLVGREFEYWNREDIAQSIVDDPDKQTGMAHSIGEPDHDPITGEIIEGKDVEPFYWYDVSPQLVDIHGQTNPNWMSAGASGSMLITEDREICGIYWGGFVSNLYYPSFSCFKTTERDFLNEILPK